MNTLSLNNSNLNSIKEMTGLQPKKNDISLLELKALAKKKGHSLRTNGFSFNIYKNEHLTIKDFWIIDLYDKQSTWDYLTNLPTIL